MLMRVWKWYQTKLATNPDSTQVISSGLLWGTRDIGAQYVSSQPENTAIYILMIKREKSFKIDWKRVATTSMFGFSFVGPVGHFWYEGLEHITRHSLRLRPSSWQFVTAKLAADSLLFGPVHLLTFFFTHLLIIK
jgi:protein Mpv17